MRDNAMDKNGSNGGQVYLGATKPQDEANKCQNIVPFRILFYPIHRHYYEFDTQTIK